MITHRGEIVRSVIKQTGYPLATLAKRLCISRGALYNRLGAKNLSYDFIIDIGYVIGFDFSLIFSALKNQKSDIVSQLEAAKDEYILLLERYNTLLVLVTKALAGTDKPYIRQKVEEFIDKKWE